MPQKPQSIESQEYRQLVANGQKLDELGLMLKAISDQIDAAGERFAGILGAQTILLQQIADDLAPEPETPSTITFKESTMLDPVAGNTLVFTGTLSPAGSAFPAGTTFTVSSSDPNVAASADATGLVVTAVLGAGFVAGENDIISWSTSTFAPVPADSPASLTASISITGVAAPVPTPVGIVFAQTT